MAAHATGGLRGRTGDGIRDRRAMAGNARLLENGPVRRGVFVSVVTHFAGQILAALEVAVGVCDRRYLIGDQEVIGSWVAEGGESRMAAAA